VKPAEKSDGMDGEMLAASTIANFVTSGASIGPATTIASTTEWLLATTIIARRVGIAERK
jgi:hypothetical protein